MVAGCLYFLIVVDFDGISIKVICTQSVRIVFFRARMQSSNSARMNKCNFTTEKIV